MSIYKHAASQTFADKYNYSLSHLQVLDEYGSLTEEVWKQQKKGDLLLSETVSLHVTSKIK